MLLRVIGQLRSFCASFRFFEVLIARVGRGFQEQQLGCHSMGPALRADAGALCPVNGTQELQPCSVNPTDIHILLVDDEKLSRVVVSNLLKKCSYRVTVAESGVEAVQVLASAGPGTFHLVLTDLMMPDVDGLDLLRYVRSHELLKELPVVMMSANGMHNTVFECLQGGAEEFLVKPVTKKEVQHIWTHVWKRVKNCQQPTVKLEVEGDVAGPSLNALKLGNVMSQVSFQQQHLSSIHRPPHSMLATLSAQVQCPIAVQGSAAETQVSPEREELSLTLKTPNSKCSSRGRPDRVLMSRWLQRPGRVVDAKESSWIFCEVLLLLERFHAHCAEAVKLVRPSRLVLHSSGRVTVNGIAEQCNSGGPCSGDSCYVSPEEQQGAVGTNKSDMYRLGVLLFELFHVSDDRLRALKDLRQNGPPASFTTQFPQESAVARELLSPDVACRPNVRDLINSETFRGLCQSLRLRHQQLSAQEQLPESQVLLDFLKLMQQRKRAEVEKVETQLSAVNQDIGAVASKLSSLTAGCTNGTIPTKRARLSLDVTEPASNSQAEAEARWRRVVDRFELFEESFMHRRSAPGNLGRNATSTSEPISLPNHLQDFSVDLCQFAQHERLQSVANLRYGDAYSTANMVCSVSFDRDDEYFAAAGVGKRIKIYELSSVLNNVMGVNYPVLEITSRSRLSSVSWSSYVKNHLVSADYEGVVQLWDASSSTEILQYEEHAKRVWSVDFSKLDPARLLSGSDDGTVKLWTITQENSVMTIDSKANVCSVQFSPISSNLVAFGSANYHVYLYDLRNAQVPVAVIPGHSKAVSYVRFMEGNLLASASIDNTVKLWDTTSVSSSGNCNCVGTFTGHVNEKNFVGLSVTPEGYIACGSETSEVFCYYKAMGFPLASLHVGHQDFDSHAEFVDPHAQFVSSVCWAKSSKVLLAANSVGDIRVLELV